MDARASFPETMSEGLPSAVGGGMFSIFFRSVVYLMELCVVGGGCIGLGVAGRLAVNHSVHLFDRGRFGRGSTYAAAGMIAPITEVEFGEQELLDLGLRSRELYPDFVENLQDETGRNVDFRS